MGKSARTEIDLNSGKQKPSQPVGFAESLFFPEYESTEIKSFLTLIMLTNASYYSVETKYFDNRA